MTQAVTAPVSPMLAKLVRDMPAGDTWWYEPKWDGFRCIVFRDGDDVELGSRNERPLTRYFPELMDPIRASVPDHAVLDGEIVILGEHGLDFDMLSQRIHPAASRIEKLSGEIPAAFVAFDLLAVDGTDLRDQPFRDRRVALEQALADPAPSIYLTPLTRDQAVAQQWFEQFEGAGLDGVIAKGTEDPYREGERGWLKIKHLRTADCVVAGYRVHKDGVGVGSLLLGLYDDDGTLHHVGVASSFNAAVRAELVDELAPLRDGALDGHPWGDWAQAAADVGDGQRKPGGQSRWNAKKDLSWEPLRIERVAEVAYEHMQGDRFRHTARFQRWRDDRTPESCTYEQLEVPVPVALREVFGA
ncbi:MAG: ATP-dependent DNA ligase [Acidimicrobiia bacterium]